MISLIRERETRNSPKETKMKTPKTTTNSKTAKATKSEVRDPRFAELDKAIALEPIVTAPAPVTVKVPVIRTAEMRTASALKAAATKTPEQRSNAAKAAWITIRANRAAAALAAAEAQPIAA